MVITICGPQPGKKPKKIAISGTNGNQISKNVFKSYSVKYMNISKVRNPHITQVVQNLLYQQLLMKDFCFCQ